MYKINWLYLSFQSFLFYFLFYYLSAAATERLKLASTTSTANSGLLKFLHPVFEKKTGVRVDTIVVGTGKALKLGENGDVDVVLVHARKAEDAFVEAGYGVNRRDVMYNDFIIVGPARDPARIRGLNDVNQAMLQIASSESLWFSRGDNSGTHNKEQNLWDMQDFSPQGNWYRSIGQGMGKTLLAADEKRAYTLSDRSTFIALTSESKIDLELLVEGDPPINNHYGVIAVNPARHPHVKYQLAMRYIAFLTSQEGQQRISSFRMQGKILFYPHSGG